MDAVEKLLKKVSKKDKLILLEIMLLVQKGEVTGIKLKGKNLYRVRVGNYRIIYSTERNQVVIESIRRRNENTYK